MSYWRFHRSLITIKCSCEVTNAFTPQLTILVGIINSLFNCIPLSCLTKIFCCSKIFCCFSPSNLADAINNELRNRESWCQKYSKTKDQIWTKFMSYSKVHWKQAEKRKWVQIFRFTNAIWRWQDSSESRRDWPLLTYSVSCSPNKTVSLRVPPLFFCCLQVSEHGCVIG